MKEMELDRNEVDFA